MLYSDGTTYKDLNDAGYTTHPYSTVSPFDGTSGPLDWDYLYDVSGLVAQNTSSTTAGTVDEGQLRNIMNAEAFTVDGKQYLFIGGYVSGGASIYEIDPVTGMPSTFIDHVESATSSTSDDDDDWFSTGEEWNYITVQRVDATGEYVITVLSQSSAVHFGFDPNGGHSSLDPNSTGALTWIGTEGNEKTATSIKNYDTDGTNYLGWTDPNSNTSQLNGYEILPDGKILAVNDQGLWLADAGVTDVKSFSAGDYIVTGTSGNDLIDATYFGDPDGDIVDNNDGNPNSPNVGDDDTFLNVNGDGCDSIVGGETEETTGDTLDLSGATAGVSLTYTGAEAGTFGFAGEGMSGSTGSVTSTGTDPYLDPANVYSGYGFISTDLLVGHTDDDDLEHIVVNGQDYIIMSGSQAVEIWAMDGITGELTKTQTLPLPETSDQGRSGIDLVNMTNDAGETNTYMYVQSLDFVNVFALDSASGQWNTVNGYLTSDMPIDGPGSGYSEVLSMPDGTTYLYTASGYQSEPTNAIYRFELDPTTNTVLAEHHVANMGSRPTYAVDDNITAGGGNDSVTACWSIHPSASA